MSEPSEDVVFLREKAARFASLALTCDNPVTAARLLELSVELEAKAAEIEARNRPPRE